MCILILLSKRDEVEYGQERNGSQYTLHVSLSMSESTELDRQTSPYLPLFPAQELGWEGMEVSV